MILVTTPTGNTGSIVLQQLVEQGQKVKIFLRDPRKIPADILEKVEVATGSLLNEYEFTEALRGCDTLYFCVPQSNTQEDVNGYYEDFAKWLHNQLKMQVQKESFIYPAAVKKAICRQVLSQLYTRGKI